MRNNTWKKICSIIVSILIFAALSASAAQAEEPAEEPAKEPITVKIGLMVFSEIDNGMWEYDARAGVLNGFVPDMLRAIRDIDGAITLDYELFKFMSEYGETNPNVNEAAAAAGCDILVGTYFFDTMSDPYFEFFEEPYMLEKIVYVTTDPSAPEVSSLADLAGKEITADYYTYECIAIDEYNEQNPDNPIIYNRQDSNLIIYDLFTGAYDDALFNTAYLDPFTYDLSKFKIYALSDLDENYFLTGMFMMYLTSEKDLADRISDDIKKLKENGTLTELSEKYYGIDLSVPADFEYEEVIKNSEELTRRIDELIASY